MSFNWYSHCAVSCIFQDSDPFLKNKISDLCSKFNSYMDTSMPSRLVLNYIFDFLNSDK